METVPVDSYYDVALSIASEAHRGQFDKAGVPYILHPVTVAERVQGAEAKAVALLHDVVEDTPVTLEEIAEAGFPPSVVEAVNAISKREGEEYEEYLVRVKTNPLARQVKIADLDHNMELHRLPVITEQDIAQSQKYQKAKTFLLQP